MATLTPKLLSVEELEDMILDLDVKDEHHPAEEKHLPTSSAARSNNIFESKTPNIKQETVSRISLGDEPMKDQRLGPAQSNKHLQLPKVEPGISPEAAIQAPSESDSTVSESSPEPSIPGKLVAATNSGPSSTSSQSSSKPADYMTTLLDGNGDPRLCDGYYFYSERDAERGRVRHMTAEQAFHKLEEKPPGVEVSDIAVAYVSAGPEWTAAQGFINDDVGGEKETLPV